MSNVPPKRIIWSSVFAFIMLGGLVWGIRFYPFFAFSVFLPLLLLLLAITNYFRGKEKMKKEGSWRAKWYTQYNMIVAIAWIMCALLLPVYFFIPTSSFLVLKAIVMGTLSLFISSLLLYAFVSYWQQRKI
jgi:hypothetical protein